MNSLVLLALPAVSSPISDKVENLPRLCYTVQVAFLFLFILLIFLFIFSGRWMLFVFDSPYSQQWFLRSGLMGIYPFNPPQPIVSGMKIMAKCPKNWFIGKQHVFRDMSQIFKSANRRVRLRIAHPHFEREQGQERPNLLEAT